MDKAMMDFIIGSHGNVSELENSGKSSNFIDESQFPPVDEKRIGALAKSLSNLLSYTVNPLLHQRYCIQMQVVKILRDWIEIEGFQKIPCNFTDGSETLNLVMRLLKKNLTNKKLREAPPENLELLARLMFALSREDSSLLKSLYQVVLHLLKSKPTESSNIFLQSFISCPEIENDIIQETYSARRSHFIEKPLIDNFVSFVSHNDINEFKGDDCFEKLLAKCVQFPSVFRLSCEYLKNIFKETEYSKSALDYSQFFAKKIASICESTDVPLFNLYPENLVVCSALMSIEESIHSTRSKNNVCKAAIKAFCKCSYDVVIMISHFPDWLENIYSVLVEPQPDNDLSMECSD